MLIVSCVCFSGVVFYYCIQQTVIWGVFRAVFLFWAVRFPFSFWKLQTSGKKRYAHLISVLSALVIPLPGSLMPLKDGFYSVSNPTMSCAMRNIDLQYYTITLPLSIAMGTACCLLLLTFWTIFKVHDLNDRKGKGTPS